ncbi:MAG: hypothetical protein U0531_20315 [Dehalococcoidia bacterium]
MQTQDVVARAFDWPAGEGSDRERALARLVELVRQCRDLERMRAGDRPAPLPTVRRAVFAAYRDAVAAGAEAEAKRLLHGGAGTRARERA